LTIAVVSAAAACSPPAPIKHFVNDSSDMGFSLEVFPMGGVHNEYQRPTKKEKRAAAGKATVSGRKKPSRPQRPGSLVSR